MVFGNNKSRLIMFLLLFVLFIFLSACSSDDSTSSSDGNSDGNSGSSSNDSNSENGESVEITWLVTTSPVRGDWYTQMVEGFEDDNPNVSVELITIPQAEIDQRLSTMLAGGNAPDVWSPNWSHSGFATYQMRGVLKDLTEYVEKDAEFLAGIPEELMSTYVVGGKNYGIPMLNMGTYIFYNKDLFDEAGVEYPTVDWDDTSWNWDEMVDRAKQLAQNTDNPNEAIYGLYNGETPNRFAWLFGGDYFTEEAYETGEMGEPQAVENPQNKVALQANYDLIYEHKVSPTPSQVEAISQISDPFLTGRTAMVINGGWGIMSYLPAEFNWGFAALPYGGEKRQVPMYVDPWTISEDSENPDIAWEFIKYISDPSSPDGGGYKQMIDLNNPPVYEDLFEEYYETIASHENIDMTVEEVKTAIEGSLKYGRSADNHQISDFSNIRTIMTQTIDAVYNDNKGIDEALQEVDENLKNLSN